MAFRFDAFRWPQQGLKLLEAALVAALAVQAVRLFWAVLAPAGPFGTPMVSPPPRTDFTILSRFDPFFRGLPDGGAAASSNGGGFVLYGVRLAADGRGAAILGKGDGRQDAFTVGQSVAPGVTLAAVGRDHVILSRGGVRTRIAFQPSAPGAYTPPPTPSPAPQAAGAITPKAFLSQNSFEPHIENGQVLGYAVTARDGGQTLQAAGLQPGDIIRAINGSPLSRNRFEEIEAEFAGSQQVELTIERGGQTVTRQLRVAQ